MRKGKPLSLLFCVALVFLLFGSVGAATQQKANETINYIDNNTSNEDGNANKGTVANFANMQSAPDSSYATMVEANTGGGAWDIDWLTGYTYRKLHSVWSDGDEENYTLSFTVHRQEGGDTLDDVYVNDSCLASFGDIRFTLADGTTELGYFIDTIYTVEDYFDDDSKRRSVDGGTRPTAWYDSASDTTFIVWYDHDAHPQIIYYNHSLEGTINEKWSSKYEIDNTGTFESHFTPSVLVDADGYIHVIYGYHLGEAAEPDNHYKRSTNPYDISSWTTMSEPITGDLEYQHLSYDPVSETIHYFISKRTTQWLLEYCNSTDNGDTWSTVQSLINYDYSAENDAFYCLGWSGYETKTEHLELVWSWYDHDIAKRRNVYYAYMNVTTGILFSMDGDNLGTTITKTESDTYCKLVDTGTFMIRPPHLQLEPVNGYPYIDYIVDNTTMGEINHRMIFWNGTVWTDIQICNLTMLDASSSFMAFTMYNSSYGEMFLYSGGDVLTEKGGDLQFWTYDGTSWSNDSVIYDYETKYPNRQYPIGVAATVRGDTTGIDFNSTIKVVFSERLTNVYDSVQDIRTFAWGSEGFVTYPADEGAIISVQFQNMVAGYNTFYMYYGNTTNGAGITTGNVTSAYPIYDDFEDNDMDEWDQVVGGFSTTGTYYHDGSYGAGGNNAVCYANRSLPNPTVVGYLSMWWYPVSTTDRCYFYVRKAGVSSLALVYLAYDADGDSGKGSDVFLYADSGGVYQVMASGCPESNWYYLRILFNCTSDTFDGWVYNSTLDLVGSVSDAEFRFTGDTAVDIRPTLASSGSPECYWDSFTFMNYSEGVWNEGWDDSLTYQEYAIANGYDRFDTDLDGVPDVGTETYPNNARLLNDEYMTLTETGGSTSILDGVDNNTSNADGLDDVGTEALFTNAQSTTPDSLNMSLTEADTGSAVNEWVWVNLFTNTWTDWTTTGTTPFLDAQDSSNKIGTTTNDGETGWFEFDPTTGPSGSGYTVNLTIYFLTGDGNDDLYWELDWTDDGVADASGTIDNPTSGWYTASASISGLDTKAEIEECRLYMQYQKSAGPVLMEIDAARLGVSKSAATVYELNMEYRWLSADYDETNENVSIYVRGTVSENLNVSYWTGSQWTFLGQITSNGWTNLTATGLDSETYIIRIRDAVDVGDSSQDTWYIDVLMLHCYTSGGNDELDVEYAWTSATYHYTNENVSIYVFSHTGSENLNVSYWTGSAWTLLGQITSTGWTNFTATGLSQLNYTIRLDDPSSSEGTADVWKIDVIMLRVWNSTGGGTNYELDMEIQWTTADYDETVEIICINTGSFNTTEDIQVWVWNETQTSWTQLWSDLTASVWNNKTVTNTVVAGNVTLRFLGGSESGDTERSGWEFDSVCLQTYSWDYTEEREDLLSLLSEHETSAGFSRGFEDLLALLSTETLSAGFTRAFEDLMGLLSQATLTLDFSRTFEDLLALASTPTLTASFVITLFDLLALLSMAILSKGYNREFEDILTLGSSVTLTFDASRSFGDILGLYSAYELTQSLSRSFDDVLGLLSEAVISANFSRSFEDVLGLLSGVTNTVTANISVGDLLGLASTYELTQNISRSFEDTLDLLSEVTTSSGFSRSFDDILGFLSEVETTVSKQILLDDILGFTSEANTTLTAVKNLEDVLGLLSQTTNTGTFSTALEDVLGFLSEVETTVSKQVLLDDVLGFTSEANTTTTAIRNLGDTLGFTSEANTTLTAVKNLEDVLGFLSQVENTVSKQVLLDDILGFTSEVTNTTSFSRSFDDILGLSSGYELTQGISRVFEDLLDFLSTAYPEKNAGGTAYEEYLYDILGLLSTPTISTTFSRTLEDVLGFLSQITTTGTFSKPLYDILGFLSQTTNTGTFSTTLEDVLGLLSQATPVKGVYRTFYDLLGLGSNEALSNWDSINLHDLLGFTTNDPFSPYYPDETTPTGGGPRARFASIISMLMLAGLIVTGLVICLWYVEEREKDKKKKKKRKGRKKRKSKKRKKKRKTYYLMQEKI